MVFEDLMYRLPLPERSEQTRGKKVKLDSNVEPIHHPILSCPMVLPSLLDDTQHMQFLHDIWGHPSESTARKNYKHHNGKGFPLDFMSLLPRTSCLVCPMSKGARPYKHSATFLEHCQQRVPQQQACTLEVEEDDIEVTVGNATPETIRPDGRVDLSIDFTHAIHPGVGKERYYLVIAAHGVEFT